MSNSAEGAFNAITAGDQFTGPDFTVSRDTIKRFAEASLDFNPLHFDDDYMGGNFGKTKFDDVIMHGMNNFALITRTLTDWLIPRGGYHRRLETKWVKPVTPGDTITPNVIVTDKVMTDGSRWVMLDVRVANQHDQTVATGQAMAEFPDHIPGTQAAS